MPIAHEVATELRKVADALDLQPDTTIIKPWLWFYGEKKELFLSTARLLPRPITKSIGNNILDKSRGEFCPEVVKPSECRGGLR